MENDRIAKRVYLREEQEVDDTRKECLRKRFGCQLSKVNGA